MAESQDNRYRFNRLSAWVKFGEDQTEYDIASVVTEFAVNAIPSCSVQAAVGIDPRTNQPAPLHLKAGTLKRRERIQVYCRAEGRSYPGLPSGKTIRIFDGYIADVAYKRGTSAASLTIRALHWLSDLTIGTKFSDFSHPTNPAHVHAPIHRAVMDSRASDNAGFDAKSTLMSESAVRDGVWLGGIKRAYNFLMEEDKSFFNVDALKEVIREELLKPGRIAKPALDRMDNPEEIALSSTAIKPIWGEGVQNHFKSTLSRDIADHRSGATFWATMVNLANVYQFSVIPNVESATCAPMIRPFGGDVWRGIEADEYDNIDMTGYAGFSIRGLGLYDQLRNFTGVTESKDTLYSNDNLVGYYDVVSSGETEDLTDGQIMFLQAPGWCEVSEIVEDESGRTYTERTKDPVTPQTSETETPPEIDGPDANEQAAAASAYETVATQPGNALAKLLFLENVYRSRTGSMNSKLRFDIAPGSSIRIGVVGKKIPVFNTENNNLYACVERVTTVIDALSSRAATTLSLTALRTTAEQNSGLAVKEHPLYNDIWSGTWLVKEADNG